MDLRNDMLAIPLDQRFTYDAQQNLFFINLERFVVRSRADIERYRVMPSRPDSRRSAAASTPSSTTTISRFCPNCSTNIPPWCASLTDRYYSGVSRYTTSGFLRIKLGEALEKRGVAPHIFESADEAQSDWRNVEGGDEARPEPNRRAS